MLKRLAYLALLLASLLIVADRLLSVSAQVPGFLIQLANGGSGSGLETQRAASLANFTVSSTLTTRNVAGVQLMTLPSMWAVVSFPAANSQATASIAAEAAVRHVARCVTWAASAAAAVTAADGNIVIRDGATGAGTIIWQAAVAHAVAAGAGIQTIPPHTVCELNLVGSTNTAMTAEMNAGVTGEHQSVSLAGYNVQ